MKPGFCVIALLLFAAIVQAQYKVQFRFKRLPSYHKTTDTIYLAGSVNNWNPKDKKYYYTSRRSGITIDLPKGMFQYKFTLGSWDGVESGNEGFPTENRILTVESD